MYIDIETAIKKHIENERKRIRSQNNPIINYQIELYIKTIGEATPKDSKSLASLITKKKSEMRAAAGISIRDKLCIELQAHERLYGIVQRTECGEPLEGLAY
jgi:hypothetical protein